MSESFETFDQHARTPLSVRPLCTLPGHQGGVEAVAFGSSGQWVVSTDHTALWIWEAATDGAWALRRTLPVGCWHFALASDGRTIAAPVGSRAVQLWSVDGTLEETIPLSQWAVDVCFSPDGRLLAIGDEEGLVHLWDRASHTFGASFSAASTPKVPPRPAGFFSWARDAISLAVTCEDQHGAVQLWAIEHQQEPRRETPALLAVTWRGACFSHEQFLYHPMLSPDGQFLAVVDWDRGSIELVETATGTSLKTLYPPERAAPPWKPVFSPDGNYLAVATFNGWVCMWQTRTWELLTCFAAHTEGSNGDEEPVIEGLAWSPDGRLLATGGYAATSRSPQQIQLGTPPQGYALKLWAVQQSDR